MKIEEMGHTKRRGTITASLVGCQVWSLRMRFLLPLLTIIDLDWDPSDYEHWRMGVYGRYRNLMMMLITASEMLSSVAQVLFALSLRGRARCGTQQG